MKKRLALFFSLFHLLLVICGAIHFYFWNFGFLGRALDQYGILSGAGNSYPFFAPVVGTSIRAQFDLFDTIGKKIGEDSLSRSPSREITLRLNNVVQMIDEDLSNRGIRHTLAASWAGKMFARHPNASKITLRVETQDLPTMKDYKLGERFDWVTIYSATFARKEKQNVESH